MTSIKVLTEPRIINFRLGMGARYLTALTHSTWSTKTPSEIAEGFAKDEEAYKKKFGLAKDAIKYGYSSILDSANVYVETIVPRYATLAACSFYVGSSFLQQSLRYTVPEISYEQVKESIIFVPETLSDQQEKIKRHHEKALEIYRDVSKNVQVLATRNPQEEGRYFLGWDVGAFIFCNWNLNHLTHQRALLKKLPDGHAPTIWQKLAEAVYQNLQRTDSGLAKIVDDAASHLALGKFYPVPYPFESNRMALEYSGRFNKDGRSDVRLISSDLKPIAHLPGERIREIALKGRKEGDYHELQMVNFTFAVKESGVVRHEVIRHRTVPQQSVSIQDAARRGEMMLTAPLRRLETDAPQLFTQMNDYLAESTAFWEDLGGHSNPDSISVITHNPEFTTILQLDGYNIFNARGFIGNRTCKLAQTETELVADLINKKINEELEQHENLKDLQKVTHANCFKLGVCPEIPRRAEKCPIFKEQRFTEELFAEN